MIEEKTTQENTYGITPEMRKEYLKKLEQMIEEQRIKAVQTKEDLYRHAEDIGQTQEEIKAEVDEFLQMLEEDRKLSLERERELFG